jgi:riboflavin kinase/FMN adenylyltransferase
VLRWDGLDAVPGNRPAAVVTVGVFDGVHRGHQAILRRALEDAAARDAETVVVTFDPHPDAVVRPDKAPLLLTDIDERLRLFAAFGVDATLVLPFNHEMSLWSPEDFARRVVVELLNAVRVVVGANFRFGHRAAGDVETLRQIGRGSGFDVDAVGLVGGEVPVSSTSIRALLGAGDVATAAVALGRPHRIVGPVVRGDGRGRDLGCPTANLRLVPGLVVPADGVYAGWLERRSDGMRWPAAISVGSNPTFDGVERRVEAHAIDTDVDLYDEVVAVEFTDKLRDMVKFDSVEQLVKQMVADVNDARHRLVLSSRD